MASTISCPIIPCIEIIPGPLNAGNLIRISGTPADSATCFAINLQLGSSTDPRSDIALHLSPVFSPPPRLVRNSLENQNWGPEESHGPSFPLSCGQHFEILILAESDQFKIAVNGQHFTEFPYRLPLHTISHITVDGDVTIGEIKFEGLAKSPMNSGAGENINKPMGFVVEPETQASFAPPLVSGRPRSPYGTSSLPYPTNPSFGPSPTSYNIPSPTDNPYGPPGSNPYGPPASNYGPPDSNPYSPSHMQNPYGPQSNTYPSGRVSPSPYGPPPESTSPYGPPGGYPYSPQHGYPQQSGYPQGGSYPQGYPQGGSYPQGYPQGGSYPQGYPASNNPYPSQSGPYPGTSVVYPVSTNPFPYPYPYEPPGPYPGTSFVYPGQEKKGGGGFDLSNLATAGAAALAGAAGASMLGGKKHKKHKHGHGIPGMSGAGPASLISGVGSLLSGSGGKHGHGHSGGSAIPGGAMGGALAGGAAALAGAYMINKCPIGKIMKPKKMKKMYKGGWGSSSSSSSSSD